MRAGVPRGQIILTPRHTWLDLAGGGGCRDGLFLVDGRACLAAAEAAADRGEVPDGAGYLEAEGVPEDDVA